MNRREVATKLPDEALEGCPRCGGDLFLREEPTCRDCGWRDFNYRPPRLFPTQSVFGSARSFRVRYLGETEALRGRVIDVTIVKTGVDELRAGRPYSNHSVVKYRPSCPFCGTAMAQTSMAGREKQRHADLTKYRCASRHSIKLTNPNQGVLTWS